MALRNILGIAAAFSLFAFVQEANAVPAFAVQTGQACSACHVGGFGPQLTPLGREFKLEGYTMRSGSDFTAPVSAMAVASYIHTAKDQPSPPAPHYATNDNLTLDQASLFLAGGYGDHFGGLAQFTYDGVGRALTWDNLDLRAVDHGTVDGEDLLFGLTFNNNPGVEDAWNTFPAWGFPYTGSDLSPAPATGTVLASALAQTVVGLNAYVWWNSSIYAEAGLYVTPGKNFLRAMGVSSDDPGPLSGAAPYLRAAYAKSYDDQNYQVGVFGFFPDIYPGNDHSVGKADHYRDVGVDASYQFTGDGTNIYQVNAIYTNEHQSLGASSLLGASSTSDTLNDVRFDASYYWHNEIGGTVQFFNTWGSRDALLYADNATFKPDSTGFVFQVDGTPFGVEPSGLGVRFNIRVGAQYTVYTKFDGAASNYDGLGRNASDNNTIRVFTWLAL
jgi:hypothetical protein